MIPSGIRVDPNKQEDYNLLSYAVEGGRAADWEHQVVNHIPLRGRTFVDVGANEGQWSKWFCRTYEQVHAFEPHPWALRALRTDKPDNLTVYPAALRERNRKIVLTAHRGITGWTSPVFRGPVLGRPAPNMEIEVAGRTLDSYNITSIDLLKVDVEGGELQVLQGGHKTIKRERPVVVVELHLEGTPDNYKETILDVFRNESYKRVFIFRHHLEEYRGRIEWAVGQP